MANIYNAGQLAAAIKQMAQNDVPDLGNDTAQNNFIFLYLNLALTELARLAFLVTYSDTLAVTTTGWYDFLKNAASIQTTLFEPQLILPFPESGSTSYIKRTSYEAPVGWWRESQDQGVHIKGLEAGNYTLKYLRYPKQITIATDIVEFPTSGNATLCKTVVGMIKLSKNSYAGMQALDSSAKQSMGAAAQGSISAKGTNSSGQPLNTADVANARGQ